MMKGIFKNGKLIGLLAVGLLVVGCMGGGSDSTEPAVPIDQAGSYGVQVTVDPINGTLTIGDGTGPASILDGSFQIRNDANDPSCSTVGGADEVACMIRVVNQSAAQYAANAMLLGTQCATCAGDGAMIDNADLTAGVASGPANGVVIGQITGDEGGSGGSIVADGFGICIVEDGDYLAGSPYNVKGCKVTPISADQKPRQVMHPECGSFPVLLDFSGAVGTYTFTVTVDAEWFNWNPTAGDARYNFNERSTYYIMVTALDDDVVGGPGKLGDKAMASDWLRIGSYRRSSILSGWGAVGSNALNSGDLFAVNVAMEFADTYEDQVIGDKFNIGAGYRYAATIGYQFRYDTQTVAPIAAQQDVGLDTIYPGGQFDCINEVAGLKTGNNCAIGMDLYTGYGTKMTAGADGHYAGPGWIGAVFNLASDFSAFAKYQAMATIDGKVGLNVNNGTASPQAAPVMNAHYGLVDMVMTPINYGTNTHLWMPSSTALNAIVAQHGADAAPDAPLAMYYFSVIAGVGEGMSSEFWISQFSTNTSILYAYTDTSMYPSGIKTLTGDWTAMCLSTGSGLENSPCTGSGDVWILSGNETRNPDIEHKGPGASNGVFQQWPAHICVN